MTLQLAVRITGDASSLVRAAEEGERAQDALNASLERTGVGAASSAQQLGALGTAATGLATAQGRVAGDARATAEALEGIARAATQAEQAMTSAGAASARAKVSLAQNTAELVALGRSEATARNAQTALAERFGIGATPATFGGATFSALEEQERRRESIEQARAAHDAEVYQRRIAERFAIGAAPATFGGASFSALEEQERRRESIEQVRAAHDAEVYQRRIAERFAIGAAPATARGATFSALEEAAADQEAMARTAAALRAQIDPLAVAQEKYNARLQELRQLQKGGFISAAELAGGEALAQRDLAGTRRAGGGLRSDQWSNLGFQANDIATSFASGMPAMQILAQQGGQVAQILGDTPGGVAGGLKAVAARTMEILTPVRLVAAGFVGLGATVAYLGYSWAQSQEAIERGLSGIGRMSRATAGDINGIAEAAAVGGRFSVGEARGVATQLAATGKIDVSNISSVTALAPGFAKMFGKDIDEAGADLARIFSDPIKGAAELNARIGGLDASTQAYIRTLVEQGNRQEAIRATIAAFGPELERAAEKTSIWARAWNGLSSAADAAGRTVAKPFVEGTLQERIAAAEAELRDVQTIARTGTVIGGGPDLARAGAGRRRAATQARLDGLRQQESDEQAAAIQKAAAERSLSADSAVRATLPDIDQLDRLRTKLVALREAQGNLDTLSGMSAEGRRQLTSAIQATEAAIESYIPATERARASEALTIRSIEARTVAEKAAIAAERERLALAGQAISADEQRRRVEAARQAVFAQSTREAEDRLRSANDNAAAAGLPPYQRQLAQLDAKYREIFKADEGNLPAIAKDQQAKRRDRAAIDVEAIGGPLRDANRSVTEQAAALRIQQEAFGASTEAAARMAAAQQLLNRYMADGVPVTENLRRLIDDYAAASGKLAAAQEDLLRKQREVVGGLDDVRYGLRSGVSGLFSDVASGKNPLEGIASAVGRTATGIIDRTVSGPLVNGLFGQEGKAGGGLFGDALGGIFGKAAGLSTADITAGVVNISGPVAGIAGLTAANGNTPSAASVAAGLTGGAGSAEAAAGIVSKLSGSRADVAEYVRQAAVQRGIDPNVAVRVINQESGFNIAAQNLTAKEQSYGVMQLNTMGGLGVEALKAGIDVRDPATWRRQVDFGLDTVKRDGWRQWYGARDIGVSRWEGIGQGAPAPASSATSAVSAVTPAVTDLGTSLQQVNTSAASAAQGVASLGTDLSALPGPLAQTSQGLTQVGSSLGSGGSGGGLLGMLASLFGGGAGGSTPATVTAAGGGHVRGAGTGTSDSIPARLSDGEFVVNAAATAANLPLLHLINRGVRAPAFAAGGPVGATPPAVRWQQRAESQPAAPAAAPMEFHLHDNVGVTASQKTSRTDRGGLRLDVALDRATADAAARPGSKTNRALASTFGLRPELTRRG